MKKNWLQIVTLCLCIVLLAVVIIQGRQMAEYRLEVEREIQRLESALCNEIQSISGNLRWEMEEAGKVVEDWNLEPAGIDGENRALLAEVSVTLKQWYEDTAVRVMVEADDVLTPVYLEADGDGTYAAQVTLPVEGNGVFQLDAVITGGGLTTRESLGSWGDLSMLLPLRNAGGGWTGPEYRDGVMYSDFDILIEGSNGSEVVVWEPEFRIFRNGEAVQILTAVRAPWSSSNLGYSYAPSGDWSLACEPGDFIEIRFRCVDEWGLGYDFQFATWTAGGDTPENEVSGVGITGGAALTLFWPE